MSIQRTFSCTKDVQLVSSGGTDGGVGAGNVVSVGQTPGGAKTRTEFEFQADWGGAVAVTKAYLVVRVTDTCASPGAAVKFFVERLTSNFKEGDYANTCGVGADNDEVWPGTGTPTTTHRAEYVGTPAVGNTLQIDITTLVSDVLAANESKVRVRLIASDGAGGYDETTAARHVGFWSRERGNDGAGLKPRIEAVLSDTYAPNAPADMVPTTTDYQQQGEAATRVDTTGTVTARFTETEVPGKTAYLTASQVQFWNRFATDDISGNVTGGTKLLDTTKGDYATGALNVAHPWDLTAQPVGTEVRMRLRMRDNRGQWGPWSRLGEGRLIPNSRPYAPTNLTVDVAAATPTYGGQHSDRDKGSSVSGVETQVVLESAAGVEVIQNTTSYQQGDPTTGPYTTLNGTGAQDVAGGTVWAVNHDGRALATGERPKRRHRTIDQYGAVGDWSAWASWTVGAVALSTNIPDSGTKQDDMRPQVGASYSENISGLLVEVYAKNDLASTLLWQSGEVAVAADLASETVEYGSVGTTPADLQPGQRPYIRTSVRVRATGALTGWSALTPMWMNALPTAPPLSIVGGAVSGDGVLRVGTQRPRIEAPYTDADSPNDTATRQRATVYAGDVGGAVAYTVDRSSDIQDYVDVPSSAALAWEAAYVAAIQYADSSGDFGPLAYLAFTTHRPPLVVAGTVPDDNDPTPTINWAATFYGGATQAGYRVVVTDITGGASDQVLDSGFVEDTTATSYVVPAYVLLDGHDYEALVEITDTLGVVGELNGDPVVAFAGTAAFEMLATAVLTVTDSLPADTFTRSVTDGWGTSSSGSAYELQGTAADFDVTGTTGTQVLSAAGQPRRARMVGPAYEDITAVVKVKTDKLAVGGVLYASLGVRAVDLVTYYSAALRFNADATVDLQIAMNWLGSRTVLATYRTALTHVAGTDYWIKVKALATTISSGGGHTTEGTTLSAKAWQDGSGEPGSYQVSIFNATPDLLPPSSVLVSVNSGSGLSNAPVLFTFDSLSSSSP